MAHDTTALAAITSIERRLFRLSFLVSDVLRDVETLKASLTAADDEQEAA